MVMGIRCEYGKGMVVDDCDCDYIAVNYFENAIVIDAVVTAAGVAGVAAADDAADAAGVVVGYVFETYSYFVVVHILRKFLYQL